jgi:Protein of unknown function (DUF1579)
MKIRLLLVALAFGVTASLGRAQEGPKPGPEHDKLKAMVGDWDATVRFTGGESKGKATWKLDFGGFYLVQDFEGEFGGMKFKGRGQTGFCPIKKTYVSTWIDSMSPSPMIMTGRFDKEGKTFTEEGEGPNMEGKITKFKSVTKMADDDTINFVMYEVKDGKDNEMISITYKRKK